MESFVRVNNYDEAILVCDSILYQMDEIVNLTSSATNWGLLDILTSFVRGWFKRIDMQTIDIHLDNIKNLILRLKTEIRDLDIYFSHENIESNTGFLVDIIFDNPILDILPMFKIKKVNKAIDELQPKIQKVKQRLIALKAANEK